MSYMWVYQKVFDLWSPRILLLPYVATERWPCYATSKHTLREPHDNLRARGPQCFSTCKAFWHIWNAETSFIHTHTSTIPFPPPNILETWLSIEFVHFEGPNLRLSKNGICLIPLAVSCLFLFKLLFGLAPLSDTPIWLGSYRECTTGWMILDWILPTIVGKQANTKPIMEEYVIIQQISAHSL